MALNSVAWLFSRFGGCDYLGGGGVVELRLTVAGDGSGKGAWNSQLAIRW